MPDNKSKKFYMTIPLNKYNKTYIKRFKKVLFVYDTEKKPGRDNYDSLNNTLKLDFTSIRNDNDMVNNKKKIKEELDKIEKEGKKYDKIGIPTHTLGLKLVNRAPQTYKVISNKLIKKEATLSMEMKMAKNDNNEDNGIGMGRGMGLGLGLGMGLGLGSSKAKNNKGKTKKKSKAEMKKLDSKSRKRIKAPLKDSKKFCKVCNESMELLRQPIQESNSRNTQDYIKGLEGYIGACKKCISSCKNVGENMQNITKNKSIYQAQYPVLCRYDHEGKSKAERLRDDLKKTLIFQHRAINQE